MASTKLDDIGFYTLSDERARRAASTSSLPLSRCEILLGARCNFRCPYCRHVGGPDASRNDVERTLDHWISDGLQAVRFSGGEPTMWPGLRRIVTYAARYIPRVAISTNGSASWDTYRALIDVGVNDFSVSLDACCAADGEKMSGGVAGAWDRIVENVRRLSAHTYVTVGVVLTDDNRDLLREIVTFAHSLGVSDIRIIPAAQTGDSLQVDGLPVDNHPILRWRWNRLRKGLPVRGIHNGDSHRCALVLDDMAVMNGQHYPCTIYL